ncbi:MAG: adenylate/guanylate cyclase domain-containing protein [Acidimicrobiia bacterium]
MDEAAFRTVLKSLPTAIAVVDPDTWQIEFENAKFFEWFPPPVEATEAELGVRVPFLDVERLAGRLSESRPFQVEDEVVVSNRQVPIRFKCSKLATDDKDLGLVVASDISKERESQYMLDSYSRLAEKHARDLQKEKERTERLLLNIMPRPVFEEMRDYGTATPHKFESASIVMLDFVGFTDMAIADDPSAMVAELNDIFSAFDRIVEMFGCERLRTIGDAYVAVSGVPEPNDDHPRNAARAALRMRRYLERRNQAHAQRWEARIGINTGPVIGSLVGVQKYVYDLFGPGVNLAARMEALSEPMMITLNKTTRDRLEEAFTFSDRGEFEVKGFGTQHLFFLEGEYGERF